MSPSCVVVLCGCPALISSVSSGLIVLFPPDRSQGVAAIVKSKGELRWMLSKSSRCLSNDPRKKSWKPGGKREGRKEQGQFL